MYGGISNYRFWLNVSVIYHKSHGLFRLGVMKMNWNSDIVWRVMYRDEENKIHEEKFDNEDDAKVKFFTVDRPNRTKQLDMIKECKYYTILYEVIK